MKRSLNEISIRQPKQYRILTAIAHGLHDGKPPQEIFRVLGISDSYGYAVWRRFRSQIEQVRDTLAAGDEKPRDALLTAKKFLQDKSPGFAEIIYKVAKDENAPKRERVQAAKIGLAEAGVNEAAEPPPQINKIMKAVVLQAFYGEAPDPETAQEID